jgi:hypothetical protein
MFARKRIGRVVLGGLLVCSLGASRAALATTIYLEAESAREGGPPDAHNTITTPLLIKDDNLASDGSYLEVIAGNDSKTTMPATEGVTALHFDNPDASATFTMWARVIAPTNGDDSFWLKMDGGSPINWNGFALGSSWHWVHVTPDGGSSPSSFTLATGTHTLKIGYREDGTRVDAFIITSDGSFNPNATPTGVPGTPILSNNSESGSNAGTLLSWSEVPGATSYTLLDFDGNVVASGLTAHTSVQSSGCFQVKAVNSFGSGTASQFECAFQGDFLQRRNPDSNMSITSPMKLDINGGLATQSGTAESLSVVPAHGRGRYDFRIVGTTPIKVWAEATAPNIDNDSFWFRMDQGTWIKWNGIPNDGGCHPVANSDAGGAPVTFTLSQGSHFFEFAYREIGTVLGRFAPTETSVGFTPCED